MKPLNTGFLLSGAQMGAAQSILKRAIAEFREQDLPLSAMAANDLLDSLDRMKPFCGFNAKEARDVSI